MNTCTVGFPKINTPPLGKCLPTFLTPNRWAYFRKKTTFPPNFIQKRGELIFEGGPIFKGGSIEIMVRSVQRGVYLRELMLLHTACETAFCQLHCLCI